MEFPDEYPDALTDEVAAYGFEFTSLSDTEDGGTAVLFEADAESFVRAHPGLGIEESYGTRWPPGSLELWLRFDQFGDPVEISFEVFDLLAWAASTDPDLHARLSSMDDPADHAVAVGEVLEGVLEPEEPIRDEYLE